MIQFTIFVSAILLFLISFYLIKKQDIFLSSLQQGTQEENSHFLKQFGIMYLLLAFVAILVGMLHQTFYSLLYVFCLLIISTIFSLLFSKKIH